MPKDQLFIPQKIRVGYQERGDTYTKKLAYVIYYDSKGVLRKETSFKSWIDDKIPVQEFDNEPTSGFHLNKDVKRSSEWFGNGRNMIRIYDERGIEFEITTSNLLFILMTTNCHKRGLEGEFVYAWYGTELVLLPTDCDEYRNSTKFTELQAQKVSTRELVPGCSYKTKKQEDLIYLGRFDWYEFDYLKDDKYSYTSSTRATKKKRGHIFMDKDNEPMLLSSTTNIAIANTDIPVSNYADLMDIFAAKPYASKPVGFEECKFTKKPEDMDRYWYSDEQSAFRKKSDGKYEQVKFNLQTDYDRSSGARIKEGWDVYRNSVLQINEDGLLQTDRHGYHDRYSTNGRSVFSTDEVNAMGLVDLKVVLENGKKVPIKNYSLY